MDFDFSERLQDSQFSDGGGILKMTENTDWNYLPSPTKTYFAGRLFM